MGIHDIAKICLEIERISIRLYYLFYKQEDQPVDQKQFWYLIMREEEEHILFWKNLLSYIEKDNFENNFPNAEMAYNELIEIKKNSLSIYQRVVQKEKHNPFLLALTIEYFFLNPSFLNMFFMAKKDSVPNNPINKYSDHIKHFFDAINKWNASNTDIFLLSQMLKQKWTLAYSLVLKNNELEATNEKLKDANEKLESLVGRLANENVHNAMFQVIMEKFIPESTWKSALLMAGSRQQEIPPEEIHVTIIYGDIQGFTQFAEHKSPNEVIQQLNSFFTIITNEIYYYGGEIDKFIGDAFLAIFKDTKKAVEAAYSIQNKIDDFNDIRIKEEKEPFFVRMGINTGDVIRGNVGGDQRKDYTIIGDAVNISARLESMTSPGYILVSENVYKYIKDDYIFSDPMELLIKGRTQNINGYYIYDKQN